MRLLVREAFCCIYRVALEVKALCRCFTAPFSSSLAWCSVQSHQSLPLVNYPSTFFFSITTSPALRIPGCWGLFQLSNGKVWRHPGQVASKSQGQIGTTVFNTCGLNLQLSIILLFMSLEAGRVLRYLHRTKSDTGRNANTTQLKKTKKQTLKKILSFLILSYIMYY